MGVNVLDIELLMLGKNEVRLPVAKRRVPISMILPTKTMKLGGLSVQVPNMPRSVLDLEYGDSWGKRVYYGATGQEEITDRSIPCHIGPSAAMKDYLGLQ